MTSSNGNIFRVTDPLCGEFTGPGEFPTQRPVTRSFDVFFDLSLNKRLSKQPWGWWFETPSWSLWRQCNGWQRSTRFPQYENMSCVHDSWNPLDAIWTSSVRQCSYFAELQCYYLLSIWRCSYVIGVWSTKKVKQVGADQVRSWTKITKDVLSCLNTWFITSCVLRSSWLFKAKKLYRP